MPILLLSTLKITGIWKTALFYSSFLTPSVCLQEWMCRVDLKLTALSLAKQTVPPALFLGFHFSDNGSVNMAAHLKTWVRQTSEPHLFSFLVCLVGSGVMWVWWVDWIVCSRCCLLCGCLSARPTSSTEFAEDIRWGTLSEHHLPAPFQWHTAFLWLTSIWHACRLVLSLWAQLCGCQHHTQHCCG